MRKFMALLCILCLAFGVADAVWAQTVSEPAIILDASATPDTNGDRWMVGFKFSPTSDISVTHLGFYTSAMNAESHLVAVFSSAGTYLGSAMVDPGMEFGYAEVSPTSWLASNPLRSGEEYFILGDNVTEQYIIGDSLAGAYQANDIDLMKGWGYTGRYYDETDLTMANLGISPNCDFYAGPNFKYVSAVPVPGAIWLLGTGLIGLVGLKRRRRG